MESEILDVRNERPNETWNLYQNSTPSVTYSKPPNPLRPEGRQRGFQNKIRGDTRGIRLVWKGQICKMLLLILKVLLAVKTAMKCSRKLMIHSGEVEEIILGLMKRCPLQRR